MIEYQENIEEDIDGNRGRCVWMYEIEEEDHEAIREQILAQINDISNLPSSVCVGLLSHHYGCEIEFEIDPKDYL